MAQLAEVLRAEVGQLVLLPVGPQILDRIQFRGIAGKKLQPKRPRCWRTKSHTARLRWPGSPSQTISSLPGMWRSRCVRNSMICGLRMAPGKQSEVEVPPGHARHRRQRLPVKVILQHRRLSLRRPGTAAVGALAQSTFVDEDDGPAFFSGFFLISGQRFCFQRRIFSSSRSSARPTGRWQLQPNCRRMRQACEG